MYFAPCSDGRMIVLVSDIPTASIYRLCSLADKLYDSDRYIILYDRFEPSDEETYSQDFYTSLTTVTKKAEKILFFIHPSKKDFKDPYFKYLPSIYSFLHYHPSIKAKTFVVPPFCYPQGYSSFADSEKLKEIFSDKLRLGDFRGVPFDSSFQLPASSDQVSRFHEAVSKFALQ